MSSNLILRRLVLLGTPLALTVLMLFRPRPYGDVVGELVPIATWWVALHTIQLVLFALMGVAVYLLVDGLRDLASTVSRAVFVVFYNTGDVIAGISAGIVARGADNLPAEEQAAIAGAIEALFKIP